MAEGETEFETVVYEFLRDDDLEVDADRLAREFEVPVGLVRRWAAGTARPHPRIQRHVTSWIRKEGKKA